MLLPFLQPALQGLSSQPEPLPWEQLPSSAWAEYPERCGMPRSFPIHRRVPVQRFLRYAERPAGQRNQRIPVHRDPYSQTAQWSACRCLWKLLHRMHRSRHRKHQTVPIRRCRCPWHWRFPAVPLPVQTFHQKSFLSFLSRFPARTAGIFLWQHGTSLVPCCSVLFYLL